eukprot:TRINITY_DN6231_c0_g1_i5.p1 TRINITY_DN6231_c0_g1~~TRINITY_DN6231_c0_g1_i5.p1  ORF type:complete len:123 (-),score=10.41 TRINITY_DN6231_c0_g1_i5:340-708(-)
MSQLNHVQKVRLLYKTCLKLHRGLPLHLKAIGDTYVKDEFRRHKKADTAQTQIFMEAWAKYAIDLTKQMGIKGPHTSKKLGEDIKEPELDKFNDEQLAQLYELYQEATKPIDLEKDPHLADK